MSTIDLGLNIFCGAFLFTILVHALYKDYWTRKLFGVVEGIPIELPAVPPKEMLAERGAPYNWIKEREYSGELHELDSKAYSRFIILKHSSLEFLKGKLKDHADLTGTDEMEEHLFQIAEWGELQFLKLPDTISFSRYHDFAAWFMFAEKNANIPQYCIGIAFHQTDELLDYGFWDDWYSPTGDTLLGGFRNGKSFFIQLPEEDPGSGTIRINNTQDTNRKLFESLENEIRWDRKQMESLDYREYAIAMNPY